MTTLLPQNTARLAWTVMLSEGQLGMLPEHRQRRRLNAARRLARYHVASRARQLGMAADEWQERTIEGREDASLAVRVSARLTAGDITPPPTVTFAELLYSAPTSAEAFREWEAPRRAVYEAAREAAIARLEPAFEQLGRMINDIANAPHVERHAEALAILDRLTELLDAMHTGPDMAGRATTVRSVLVHHLDAVRRLVLHHHDLEDPAGAEERARARRGAPTIARMQANMDEAERTSQARGGSASDV